MSEASTASRWVEELVALGPELADAQLDTILTKLTDRELAAIEYDWRFWARPKQLLPGGVWRVLLMLAGRAFGKTRAATEAVIEAVQEGGARRVALISMTDEDVRKVMVEGQHSGILARSPPWFRPQWLSSKDGGKLTWPNGAIAYVYSGEAPNRIRGEELDLAWWDEPANCAREQQAAIMYNLRMALRGNDRARLVMTTTPQRGTPMISELIKRAQKSPNGLIRTVRGHTFDNAANIPLDYQQDLKNDYEGTRLGRQELAGEMLDDVEGALFKSEDIEAGRRAQAPALVRKVVAVDPAYSAKRSSDETGIVVVGIDAEGELWVLADRSGKYSPEEWARVALELVDEFDADAIVAERNRGGDLVAANIRAAKGGRSVRIIEVLATRGKATRAEPVAGLYEQKRVHHVGTLQALEDQMTGWDPAREASPDRVDALVWAVYELAALARKLTQDPVVAFEGFEEAQRAMPRPAMWCPPRGGSKHGADAGGEYLGEPGTYNEDPLAGWDRV